MRNLIRKILKEQEDDFSWVNLPELPFSGGTYTSEVEYALRNTDFWFHVDKGILNDPDIYQIKHEDGTLISFLPSEFRPSRILPYLEDIIRNHPNEWYTPLYRKLYDILIQIK